MAKKKSVNIDISLEELLEAGCHFGHTVSKIHPQMREYVYMARQGIHIFDLVKTRQRLITAAQFLADLVKEGGKVIFVGTKRQAAPIIEKKVKETDMFYIKKRWIGGLLTNWSEVKKNLVLVEDVNKVKKHVKKQSSEQPGGIVEIEKPLPISSVVKIDKVKKQTKKTTKKQLKKSPKKVTSKKK